MEGGGSARFLGQGKCMAGMRGEGGAPGLQGRASAGHQGLEWGEGFGSGLRRVR